MDIYVGNLPYDIDEQPLRDAFSEYGQVEKIKIVYDHYTGKSKGFAFVIMPNLKEAQNAVKELDGATIEGRPIKVNQAKPREDRPRRDDFKRRRY